MSPFTEQLRRFANTVDILDDDGMGEVIRHINDYIDKKYSDLVLVEVLGAGLQDETSNLFTVKNGGTEVGKRWNVPVKNRDGSYDGQVSFAFDKRRRLWIVAKDRAELSREDVVYENLWDKGSVYGLPPFKALQYSDAARVKTSIMLPLHVDGDDGYVGLVNFEFVNYFPPTEEAKLDLEEIARALAPLSLLNRIYSRQKSGTERALKDLSRAATSGGRNSGGRDHDKHLVVMVATNEEFKQLISAFHGSEKPSLTPHRHVIIQQDGKDIVLARTPQMGMPAAAATAMHLIHLYRPKYLAMSGIMAGVKGSVKLGDIVVADPSYDYGSGKLSNSTSDRSVRLHNEIRQERLSNDIRDVVSELSRDEQLCRELGNEAKTSSDDRGPPRVHIGAVGSGAAVVEVPELLDSLRENQDRKILGVEMEIYGVMYAAHNCNGPKPEVVCAKTVSDFAEPDRERSFQPPAAYLSARFIRKLIEALDRR